MGKPEQTFKSRVKRIIESKGWLVINVNMPVFGGHIIDSLAIRDQEVVPIEFKSLNGTYPKLQKERQIKTFTRVNTVFVKIHQARNGKFEYDMVNAHVHAHLMGAPVYLRDDLLKYIVD